MKRCFEIDQFDSPETLTRRLQAVTPAAVERSLSQADLDEKDLVNLLSPAAEAYLEPLARRAQAITRRRFGRIMKLYVPLYLSNECINTCVYCGFNRTQRIARKTLRPEEIQEQAQFLSSLGFRNLLLVSGESRPHVPVRMLADQIAALSADFPEISVEVYPLETREYAALQQAGLYGLVLYQETYLPEVYAAVHPSGPKHDYHARLEAPQRGAEAGLRQVGLGVLLGLTDFRLEGYYLGQHVRALEKIYWQTAFGLSFPRLRRAAGGFQAPAPVSDQQLTQLVTVLRLFLPDAPFSLSTRESASLRRHLLPLGFTQMSAGSCTEPGGYGHIQASGEQFQVEDTRSAREISADLELLGFEPVWKDWDASFREEPAEAAPAKNS